MDEKPKLIIIAGPNGSGKTTVTTQILQHEWVENCVYVNPDNIARDVFGDWNSAEAMLNAAKYAAQQRETCLKRKESLLFETVLSSPEKLDFIAKAKDAGYFVRLFFIGTENPKINASRIAQRVQEGGHDVPITKIISRYYKSVANCSYAVGMVDRAYIYDNSIDNETPRLLFRTADGNVKKTYGKVNGWAKEIWQMTVN
jgi:predicted ABC-type ATPase